MTYFLSNITEGSENKSWLKFQVGFWL